MKKLIIGMFTAGFAVTVLFNIFTSTTSASVEKKLDVILTNLNDELVQELHNKTELSMSSNPNDYIKDSDTLNKIVALGNDVILILENKIDSTPDNGLIDYILAIAIEEIAKVDLKEDTPIEKAWDSADKFSEQWKTFLHDIPTRVNEIAHSDESIDAKVEKLSKLGTPAIPFILDSIENGNEELLPIAESLIGGTPSQSITHSENTSDWVSEQKASFQEFKGYIESK